MYRVNYGNGQVSNTFELLREAQRSLANETLYRAYMFIQRYEVGSADEPGDWFTVTEREQKQRKRS